LAPNQCDSWTLGPDCQHRTGQGGKKTPRPRAQRFSSVGHIVCCLILLTRGFNGTGLSKDSLAGTSTSRGWIDMKGSTSTPRVIAQSACHPVTRKGDHCLIKMCISSLQTLDYSLSAGFKTGTLPQSSMTIVDGDFLNLV